LFEDLRPACNSDECRRHARLGLIDAATIVGDANNALRLVMDDGATLSSSGGLWVRRAKVMDRWRVEIVGAGEQRSEFTALGCFVEIIRATRRGCSRPRTSTQVLEAVLKRWPVESLLPGRQAA
jgi:hypothetical protein